MIEVRDLRVTKSGNTICRVDELTIKERERVAVVGPNGSGKTTLLRVLAGLESGYSGTCQAEASQLECVFVHQAPLLFRGTVLTNVCYGLAARGFGRKSRRQLAVEWLERFGIGHLAETNVAKLSGGEARRTALVRALILRPKLLLLDEPLADLDDAGAELLIQALDGIADSTVLIASPIELAPGLAHRSHIMNAAPR